MTVKKIEKFKLWLKERGAHILPVSNEYESLRFKGSKVGVFYKSGKHSGEYALNAYKCFSKGMAWDGRPVKTARKTKYTKEKKQLIKRDGTNCFYCGNPLEEDITLEHLIPLTSGGNNELYNMVLAHEKCNQKMGCSGINDKVNFAIKTRVEKIIS